MTHTAFARGIGIAAFTIALLMAISGCGVGGYPGGGIASLSASSIVLDAGQTVTISATKSGAEAVSWSLSGASCSGSQCGTLSGNTQSSVTYTAPAGITAQMQLTLSALLPGSKSVQSVSITVNPDPALSATLPAGVVGTVYSGTLTASGGTPALALTISSGSLPAGLSFNASTNTITGTPTTAGSFPFSVALTDSSVTPFTVTAQETIVITNSGSPAPTPLALTGGPQPGGIVGAAYTTSLVASGGVAPYAWSISAGTLPAGLSIAPATGVIAGIPTAPGTAAFTVQVADSTGATATAQASIVVSAAATTLTLTGAALPNGTVGVAYSAAIGLTGGTSPYTCAITSGTLPAGLSLSGCTVSGTPTAAGTATVTVKVTDSSSPSISVTGSETIVVVPAALALAGTTLPTGTVGVAYSSPIGLTGGTSPYTCAITSGTLPAGLSLSGCTVTGTPTTVGTATVTVKVTDSSSPSLSITGPETIVIAPAALVLTATTLPNGTVNTPYSATIGASGGTAPYSCTITSGTLPVGLILTGCTVSGLPITAGSSTVTVKVTDSGSPAQTFSGPETIVIVSATLSLTATSLPDGTVGIPYSAIIGASGGTAPYSCAITNGTLPAGLSLSGCTVSGTPTTPGSATVTIRVTDSSNPTGTATGTETITIDTATLTLVTTTLPNGTVGVSYSANISATGGTSPYSCAIIAGVLPAGLSLSGCTVSGTPTIPQTAAFTVRVTDANSPARTVTGLELITIAPLGTLSLTGTLPNPILGVAYSYTLQATGGTSPYSYSITAGALPAGLSLAADGVISGTPTAAGASSFTVTATDSAATPATASLSVVLLVVYPASAFDSELSGPYAYLFQGYDDLVAGVLAYHTAAVGSFTADGAGGINAGEVDANHQSSTPTGTTVPTQNFLGTYTVGADGRGMITITTLNADGTTDQSFTYAISLKAPVSPATVATQGSLIEYDNNQLVGTKGSGTLLAQTTSAYAAGLNGSYAFGFAGDTPCLVSCTVGVASGPVATVGQFTTDGAGNISSGVADANIASVNYASAPLNGSYQSADQNGRLQLEMTNTAISDGLYPTNYAVYIVNASEAFLMSTDKHSAYTLLAGTAQLQTQSTFSNASVNGPVIGYESAQSDPGLVGATLQNVLNFSTATVFRTSGDGAGTCDTTNVDSGGLTSLVDSLTGLANGNTLLEALLGSATTTGTSTCEVNSNGRGVLNYPQPASLVSTLLGLLGLSSGPPPPRVFYLIAPNQGYFLETSYAGLGQFEAQTGAPFNLATVDGTFVESTIPASSLASIDTSGSFTANGAGQATYTLDENVGVGNLNVLQLGVSSTTSYTLTDPNTIASAATAGRFVLGDGTTVVYAISPQRFVVIDTNPLTTSPVVSLLY
jgi:hypothetical protein